MPRVTAYVDCDDTLVLWLDDDQLKKVACPVVTWQQFVKEWGNES